ncbi:MAG: DUF3131 domain-containing protein [Paracoccaceae bacterium]
MPNSRTQTGSRSPVFFVVGLLLAVGAAIYLDGAAQVLQSSGSNKINLETPLELTLAPPTALSEQDIKDAEIAWQYFVKNTEPETGFVNAVSGIPSSTLWDLGSYLMALVSAYRIEQISEQEFDSRVENLLNSFARLELIEGKLPNKVYNTITLTMVDYQNNSIENGIGWSALDISRMLLAFRVLERHAPKYGVPIRDIIGKWDLSAMAVQGELIGASVDGDSFQYLQEGRIGYEQYAARSAAMWGMDVAHAFSANRIIDWTTIEGVDVPIDLRNSASFQSISPTLSEPYILQGLEYGFDSESRLLAEQVYLAQEARYLATGIATMVSEDHINQPPYFLYSSIYSDGEAWAVLTESGDAYTDKRTLSLKAVFAWNAIFNTDYTNTLHQDILVLASGVDGWPAGIYEIDQQVNDVYTLNTNAVILESLQYKLNGPLWQIN